MGEPILCAAVDCLREEYSNLNWTYHDSPTGATEEKCIIGRGAGGKNHGRCPSEYGPSGVVPPA